MTPHQLTAVNFHPNHLDFNSSGGHMNLAPKKTYPLSVRLPHDGRQGDGS